MIEIIEIIISLIGIAFGVAIIQSQEWYDNLLLKLKLDFKPLNCVLCLTYWLSFIFLLITTNILNAFLVSFIVAGLGEYLYRKLMNMI